MKNSLLPNSILIDFKTTYRCFSSYINCKLF